MEGTANPSGYLPLCRYWLAPPGRGIHKGHNMAHMPENHIHLHWFALCLILLAWYAGGIAVGYYIWGVA